MQLETQLAQVEVQLQTAQEEYTNRHPTVIGLRRQEAEIKREIERESGTVLANTNSVLNPLYEQLEQQQSQDSMQAAADTAQLEALRKQEHSLKPQLAQLPSEAQRLADLQVEAQSAQSVYNALQSKYNNAAIARETALSDVVITQPADPRYADVQPNLRLNLLLAVVLGLALAISSAFVIDYLDATIKDDREVEEEFALPALGAIPLMKRNGAPDLPWVRKMSIEAFLQVVTSIKYASSTPLTTLVVTSPSQGDGKSTIALNIAVTMAELEPRVLLVDADLRRASLHTKLRMSNARGLSDILVGRSGFSEVVQRTRYAGLDVLTCGTPAPNPIKLFESSAMDEFLRVAQRSYRFVVIDGPALCGNVHFAAAAAKPTAWLLSFPQTIRICARQDRRCGGCSKSACTTSWVLFSTASCPAGTTTARTMSCRPSTGRLAKRE